MPEFGNVFVMAVAFVMAVLLSLILTPLMRTVALRTGWVDRPAAHKAHTAPTPLLGGAALCTASILPVAWLGGSLAAEWWASGAALVCVALLGLVDDRLVLKPAGKGVGQLAIALGLIAAGVGADLPGVPRGVAAALSLVWLVGVTNALNLLDNADGVSGGVGAAAAAFLAVLAAQAGQWALALGAVSLFGACVGFLHFNRHPARIFMGDCGSLFLGMALAVLGLRLAFPETGRAVGWAVPVIVLGVPLGDTLLVMLSRLARRRNPFTTPGRDHVSHRLQVIGCSVRASARVQALAGCVCGLTGLLVAGSTDTTGVAITLAWFLALALSVRRLLQVRPPFSPPGRGGCNGG